MACYDSILIIDDEESIRDGCSQALAKTGYRIITAKNAQEGIRLAREYRPQVAFVDLKMPGCSGMEVIEHLTHDIEDIVVIVITGYASIVSAVEAMHRGAYDYLPKPFTSDHLRAVTKRGVEHFSLKRETRLLKEQRIVMEKNFITFVSHEMRSPLAAIEQYMESIKMIPSVIEDGDATEIISRCEKRVHELQGLIEHWLDINRIENGTFSKSKEKLDLGTIISKCIDDLMPLCMKRQLNLTTELPAGLPSVEGDEESLMRVFNNIIGNATKYTPPGGNIHVSGWFDDYYVKISVSDTGTGIPQEKIPFIFDPFFRVRDRNHGQKGSGLGLTFCKKIMDAHSGRIEVVSKPDEGSKFTLVFPR